MNEKQKAIEALNTMHRFCVVENLVAFEAVKAADKTLRDFIEGRDKQEQVDENGLKPCPFCGGEAHDYKKIVWNGETVPHIGCADCGARSPIFGDNSAKAWNTRADNTAKVAEKLNCPVCEGDDVVCGSLLNSRHCPEVMKQMDEQEHCGECEGTGRID